jgi:hypothetical protein
VGLRIQSAEVQAINNVLIDHDTGLSVTTATALAAYNDLWSNQAIIAGYSRPGDMHVDPRFRNTAQGIFIAFIPSIDAGFTLGAPASDFDSQPRPLDGNGDGLARADIGADEYQFVPLRQTFLPIVFASRR